MNAYTFLIICSVIVILSYLYTVVFRLFKIPSVILLLGTGIALRIAADTFQVPLPELDRFLEALGIIGLILIVLEGALELSLKKENIGLIKKAILSAFLILIICTFGIGAFFAYWSWMPFQTCLINAVPFAVISSAIAIPSAAHLSHEKREFITYESTFSDILGITLFNLLLHNSTFNVAIVAQFGMDTILMLIISIICCIGLIFAINRIKHEVKFFLILSCLLLVYAIGKLLHLSPLLLILVFGLVINNIGLVFQDNTQRFKRWIGLRSLQTEVKQFKILTAESAFLIRTFFFVLFGFSLQLSTLLNLKVIIGATLIVAFLILVRFIYLKYVAKTSVIPEMFLAPRGLITVLLFYSIPKTHLIPGFSRGILFLTILLTSALMTIGLLWDSKRSGVEA